MTSGRATFGDFLIATHRHLTLAGERGTVAPGPYVEEVSQGLLHFVAALGRFTTGMTRAIGQLPDRHFAHVSSWERACLQAHDALVSAAEALEGDNPGGHIYDAVTTHRTARHLRAAATSLTAGRDLLEGHFAISPGGARLHQSGLAPVISSRVVREAMLAEIVGLARHASTVSDVTARPVAPGSWVAEADTRLAVACHWLAHLERCVCAAERREPMSAGRDLLAAVPLNVMSQRRVPDRTDSIPELCAAVISTAERASHAAWDAASLGPRSTSLSATSWHRIAAASTVTSHHCHVLWTTLAERVSQDQAGPVWADMQRAAAQARCAREAWLDAARECEELTTDIRGHVSPAAAEAADLAIWTGRLAYADPGWTLASGPSQAARKASSLAPRLADVAEVVAAIHHASDSLSGLATANLEQARSAVRARRLLVATRSLPANYDVPHPFTVAPESLRGISAGLLPGHSRYCRGSRRYSGRDSSRGRRSQSDADGRQGGSAVRTESHASSRCRRDARGSRSGTAPRRDRGRTAQAGGRQSEPVVAGVSDRRGGPAGDEGGGPGTGERATKEARPMAFPNRGASCSRRTPAGCPDASRACGSRTAGGGALIARRVL